PAARWDSTKHAVTKRPIGRAARMRVTRKPEEIDANQNAGEKSQRRQGECPAEAATPVGRAGRGGRLGPAAPGTGGEQDVGVHSLAQLAEPRQPPRNPGGR